MDLILITDEKLLVVGVLVIKEDIYRFNQLNLFLKDIVFEVQRIIFDEESLASVDEKLDTVIVEAG